MLLKLNKKSKFQNYKIDNLAIGCYFFKSLNYINFFSHNLKKNFPIKKELYLLH